MRKVNIQVKKVIVRLAVVAAANIVLGPAFAAEVGYVRTQSSSSFADKYKAAHKIGNSRVSASYRLAKDTTGKVVDDTTSTTRFGYKYRFEDETTLFTEYRLIDDSYFFEGQGLNGKGSKIIFRSSDDPKAALKTRLNLGFDLYDKRYSKNSSEKLSGTVLTIGFDQEVIRFVNFGFDYSQSTYSGTSSQVQSVLDGQTVSTADVSNFVNGLTKSSALVFLEASIDPFYIGGSYSEEYPKTSIGAKYSSIDIYGDYYLDDHLTLSAGISRGKTDGYSTVSDSYTLGINYQF